MIELSRIVEVEEKLCKIYSLADKISHEQNFGILPQAIKGKTHIVSHAAMIRKCVIDAMDDLWLACLKKA